MKPTDFETMRVQELLMLQATEGLSATDQAELRRFDADKSDIFDSVAAMVELSVSHTEAMPQDVADKILQAALATRASKQTDMSTAPAVPAVAAVLTSKQLQAVPASASTGQAAQQAGQTKSRASVRPRAVSMYAGWACAAAAAAVALWSVRKNSDVRPPVERTAMAAWVDDAKPTLTQSFGNAANPAVTGTVRWNAERQQGLLDVAALPSNVGSQQRYQLWIFDSSRDEKFPVDAGLFDVTAAQTKLVFSPRVKVATATHFMITLDANGAVVSNRAHIVAITQP